MLGATGRTGVHVVDQGLAQNHHITAVVRNPDKVTTQHENLKVCFGHCTVCRSSFQNFLQSNYRIANVHSRTAVANKNMEQVAGTKFSVLNPLLFSVL